MSQQFSMQRAQQLYNSVEAFPVSFEDAWQWLGYSKKDKALRTLKNNFNDGEDFALLQEGEWSQAGRSSDLYGLTVNCFKEMGMMAGTFKGREIRKYFIECENQLKKLIKQPQTQSEITEDYELGSLLNFNKEELTIPQQLKLLDLILQYLKIGHDSMAYAIAQALGIRLIVEASDNVTLTTKVSNEIRQCVKQEIEPPKTLIEYVCEDKNLLPTQTLMTTKELYEYVSGKQGDPREIGQLGVRLKVNKATLHSKYGNKKVFVVNEKTLSIAKEYFRNS